MLILCTPPCFFVEGEDTSLFVWLLGMGRDVALQWYGHDVILCSGDNTSP